MLFETVADYVIRGIEHMISFMGPQDRELQEQWEELMTERAREPFAVDGECKSYLPDVGEDCWYCGESRNQHREQVLKAMRA